MKHMNRGIAMGNEMKRAHLKVENLMVNTCHGMKMDNKMTYVHTRMEK